MARVTFPPTLQRQFACPPVVVKAATVRVALVAAFAGNARARAYVLDDQSALRKHMVIFVDGKRIEDRTALSDSVRENGEIYVLQALSGG
jgi:hypothetical protein